MFLLIFSSLVVLPDQVTCTELSLCLRYSGIGVADNLEVSKSPSHFFTIIVILTVMPFNIIIIAINVKTRQRDAT